MSSSNDRFEKRKRESLYWHNKAGDLMSAAGAVWHAQAPTRTKMHSNGPDKDGGDRFEIATPGVFRMLCGMALELAYKSIIVSMGKKPRKSHDLNSLAAEAGLHPTSEQRDLLSLLTGSIVWDGRYPVPNDRANFDKQEALKRDCLFDRKDVGGLNVLSRNSALKWDSFLDLWSDAISAYMEHYGREHGA